MEIHQDKTQHDATSDCQPRHVREGPLLASAGQRRPGKERGLLDEAAVILAQLAQFALVLVKSAKNSERWKGAEENDVPEPPVHQHGRESEQTEGDESGMAGELLHAARAIVAG